MVHFSASMGQNSSLPKPGRRKSLRSFQRKSHNHANLSHTFTLNDNHDKVELLNINQASEEELMTLPGVSRETARSIVEHRKAIGRFRKVEDLALVRGIGADKLELLRPEICVSSRRNLSCASSRAQSYDSLRSADSRLTVKSNRLVNVNKASVFELQCVHGITQEIAAAIVHYRDKKGPFKQVEDLLKIKSIDRIRLDNISRFLTVENSDLEDTDVENPRSSILTNGFHHSVNEKKITNGGPLKLPVLNGLSSSSLFDIFELLSAYSPRPTGQEIFNFTRKGEPAIRIGVWNLHEFTFEKANNPGVREVVCRTILENGLSILAVQEVVNVTAMKLICDELNKPRLRRVNEWKDKNHNWNFCMLDVDGSQLGFIYDSDGVIDIELISLNQGPQETSDDCEVLIASFKVGDLDLQLVNMKLNKKAKLDVLQEKIKDLISEEDMLLLFVDFSAIPNITDDWLTIGGLQAAFPSSMNTSYLRSKLGLKPQHISNILCNNKIQGQVTGINGVVQQGLTHLAIPNGWNWGGPASPFCPVWMELFLNPNSGTAL
ncbi:endonuclease/exonuclease/phosphatase family domain-containing protein 1 [Tribolium castaneum]|uniref:Endonuclease/exonuclease/phosphatase family domain-containing protein 1-like Protein n=1 Tax=Tribolium castaneum TaxID=7070 RepID=D6WM33_TRICA|nr:PREDICTED: endonuclease/exonuclease/phosphatase family domain-containing protein 1 [Tribolium castaneum]EFA04215.1 Endonuclease/exonuclease/phosphatase family domain-containing protein 1-like Protein [Tribolium castaneum]|eukprot:XP_015835818.1 PREDICTED: endonuclease/exonuclease/phosphatase family domain-containing protein 1 [Tribolium castaneum]